MGSSLENRAESTPENRTEISDPKGKKQYLVIALIAFVHLLITFYTDRFVFTVPAEKNPTDYIICKIIVYFVLFALYYGLYLLIFDKSGKGEDLRSLVKYALPYLIVIIAVSFFKLRGGYLSNDERLIYENAAALEHYTWFYYITTYYYIVALMLIPNMYAPIFLKLIIEFLVVGYTVKRISEYFGKKYGIASYLFFLMYPILAYTTSAHRLPVYFLVYLYLLVMLFFDKLERAPLSRGRLLWIIFLSSILTQWRTEGIYFCVLSVILVFIAYPDFFANKEGFPVKRVTFIILTIIIQYAVSIPQNGFTAKDLSAKADDRMKPFYAYTVTNMFRNGLDREKNKEDIEIIDKYLSVEKIDEISEYYGDINYEDVLILYKEGFIGLREGAEVADFVNYAAACKRLFANNPEVFLKTRWGAFKYAALPFKINYQGMGLKPLLSFFISVVKTISYNLFIPLTLVVIFCILSLIKRCWFVFFSTGGLLAHFMIVFVLAPASYFKYYFPIYIMAYFYLMTAIFFLIQKKTGSSRDKEEGSTD